MPIYEYQCESCGRRTEVMQRISDDPLTLCTSCSGPLKKLISAPAFQFKGSGWYVTDYAKGKAKDEGGGGGGDAKDTGKAEGAKKESAAKGDGGGSSSSGGDGGAKSDAGSSSKGDVKKAS